MFTDVNDTLNIYCCQVLISQCESIMRKILTIVNIFNFYAYVEEELRKRGWSQKDLADRAGVSQSLITSIKKGSRGLGIDTFVGIMNALGQPIERGLVELGLLPRPSLNQETTRRVMYFFGQLSVGDQAEIVALMRYKVATKNVVETLSGLAKPTNEAVQQEMIDYLEETSNGNTENNSSS